MDTASFATFPTAPVSWKREVICFIASFVVGLGVSVVADTVITSLIIGAYVLTGSLFLAWVILITGWLCAIVAALYAGAAVNRYIYDRRIDRDWNSVKGFFSRSTERAKAVVIPIFGERTPPTPTTVH